MSLICSFSTRRSTESVMKVKCIRISNSETKSEEEVSPWLRLGMEYVVLAIYAPFRDKNSFLLISDDASRIPVPFDVEQFEVTCDKIPSSWKAHLDEAGQLQFAPERWLRTNFWTEFYDQDPSALEDYAIEVEEILKLSR